MKKILFVLLAMWPLFSQAQNRTARPMYDVKSIGEVRLTLPVKNWTDALDSLRIYGDGMLAGDVTIDGHPYTAAGIRYRGDKSYQQNLKRNPFSIKLNYTNKEQNHQGYTSLKISSALRDPSMVREVLFYEIAAKYMPAPQVSYVKMYVNDEYIGIFVNVESVDGQFLRRHFGSDDRPFFKAGVDYKPEVPASCKQNLNGALEFEDDINCYKGNFEMNSASGWNVLQDFTRTLNMDARNIHKSLDIDRTLWMLALNNVMVNLSSYTGSATNYYLYQDQHGHFQPVHWDLNLAFGGMKNTGSGSDLELKDLQRLDPMLHVDNPYRPLISQLLKDPLYKKIYLSHVRQIIEENFKNGAYEKRAQELQSLILTAFIDDKYKTYGLTDFQNSIRETVGKKSKIPGIAELMSVRSKFLSSHPELTTLPSTVSDVTQQSRGKFENTRLHGFRITAKADRFPKRLWLYYRLSPDQPFMEAPMDEEPGKSKSSSDRRFAVTVDAPSENAELEYYILCENAGAVSFFPKAYTVKPLKVKLMDLNK